MRRLLALLAGIGAGLALVGLVRARRRARTERPLEATSRQAADDAQQLRERLSAARAGEHAADEAGVGGSGDGRVSEAAAPTQSLDSIAADLAELESIVRAEESRSAPAPEPPEAEPVAAARERVHAAARSAARRMRG